MIQDNLLKIRQYIAETARKSGRDPDEIVLVGATKYADAGQLKEAVLAGLSHIGENRVQDAREKFVQISELTGVTKHMIGHLQSNKVKAAVELFDMIQSVDSEKLAEEIDKHASHIGKVMDILVQVNTSLEEQKSGVDPAQSIELVERISGLKNIHVMGLMTMAALTENIHEVRKSFRRLKELRDQIAERFSGNSAIEMKYLSMGMSTDFKVAIEEGANMVRIGRAVFAQ